MTNKIRRVTCVILALVLLLSANAYAVDDLGESTFTGTIIVDSESPKLLNLGEIEIEVYQSTPIETDESYTISYIVRNMLFQFIQMRMVSLHLIVPRRSFPLRYR